MPAKKTQPSPRQYTPQLGREHAEKTRAKIKSSSLLIKLQNHALKGTKMSATQIRAAEILLRKTVPDLSHVELANEGGGPVQIQVVRFSDTDTA